MTAPATAPVATSAPAAGRALIGRARDVLISEWIKLCSVRSTYWVLLAAAVTAIGESAVGAYAYGSAPLHPAPPGGARLFSLVVSLGSLQYAVLAVGVLGVLAFSSEHASGLISTTFTAVPRRRAVLAAKAACAGAVALAAGELLSFASFGLSQAILSGHHRGISLSYPGAAKAVLTAGLLLLVCALIGIGLGAIIRHTAGAIVALVTVTYLPVLAYLSLPSPWNFRIIRFTLLGAAVQVGSPRELAGLFSPALSVLILIGWPAALLLAAALLITRRDA
jgi:ABC-2 type transport system permease protein